MQIKASEKKYFSVKVVWLTLVSLEIPTFTWLYNLSGSIALSQDHA